MPPQLILSAVWPSPGQRQGPSHRHVQRPRGQRTPTSCAHLPKVQSSGRSLQAPARHPAAQRARGLPLFLKIDTERGRYDPLPSIATLLADPRSPPASLSTPKFCACPSPPENSARSGRPPSCSVICIYRCSDLDPPDQRRGWNFGRPGATRAEAAPPLPLPDRACDRREIVSGPIQRAPSRWRRETDCS